MTVSMHIPCGETISFPIRNSELMQAFGKGQYIKIEKSPGSGVFIMGKIASIMLESGYPDGKVPTCFNVSIYHPSNPIQGQIFVRTVG